MCQSLPPPPPSAFWSFLHAAVNDWTDLLIGCCPCCPHPNAAACSIDGKSHAYTTKHPPSTSITFWQMPMAHPIQISFPYCPLIQSKKKNSLYSFPLMARRQMLCPHSLSASPATQTPFPVLPLCLFVLCGREEIWRTDNNNRHYSLLHVLLLLLLSVSSTNVSIFVWLVHSAFAAASFLVVPGRWRRTDCALALAACPLTGFALISFLAFDPTKNLLLLLQTIWPCPMWDDGRRHEWAREGNGCADSFAAPKFLQQTKHTHTQLPPFFWLLLPIANLAT